KPGGHVGDVPADALGQRLGQVAGRAGIRDRLVAVVQLDRGGKRPRARDLEFQRAGVVLGEVLEGVEVAGEEVERPAQVPARPVDQPPTGRLQVDRHVDEERRAAADHVRAGPAGWQLGHVWQVGQLAEDGLRRLGRVGAGHRSHAGGDAGQLLVGHGGDPRACLPAARRRRRHPDAAGIDGHGRSAELSVPRGSITGMYAERAPAPDLAGHLRCSWTRLTGGSGSVLPDGCLDLMWIGGELVVAGPDTVATHAELAAGVEIAAVRFRPGVAPAVLGLPASELRDQRVPLTELWPDAPALGHRVGAAVGRRLASRTGGPGVVAELARRAGLSERQLHRRCVTAFGYGPKTLDRILRLQRFLALGRAEPTAGLARLAADAGYTDQAHLGHDCRALADATPAELIA